jgi:hypothetical protein
MNIPVTTVKPSGGGIPWKTIAGVALWALGVILHAILPANPPTLPLVAQGVGAGLGSYGAVSAMADLVGQAPFMRFSNLQATKWWPSVMMLSGGGYYGVTRVLDAIQPSWHVPLVVSGALTVVASVVGWRLWLHQLVSQSKSA